MPRSIHVIARLFKMAGLIGTLFAVTLTLCGMMMLWYVTSLLSLDADYGELLPDHAAILIGLAGGIIGCGVVLTIWLAAGAILASNVFEDETSSK